MMMKLTTAPLYCHCTTRENVKKYRLCQLFIKAMNRIIILILEYVIKMNMSHQVLKVVTLCVYYADLHPTPPPVDCFINHHMIKFWPHVHQLLSQLMRILHWC